MTTWIFGASGSIGRSICKSVVERGDRTIAFTSNTESATKLETDLKEMGEVTVLGLDLQSRNALEVLIHLAKETEPEHIIYLARGPIALDSNSRKE